MVIERTFDVNERFAPRLERLVAAPSGRFRRAEEGCQFHLRAIGETVQKQKY
jgi:hypothetical protein